MTWSKFDIRVLCRAFACLATAGMLVPLSGGAALSDPVRVQGGQYIGDLPTLISEEKGFFKKNGLEVEVGYGLSGKANLAALRRGDVDYALMTMTPFVLDRLGDPTPGEDGDPVILANLTHGAPNIKIIARHDAGGSEILDHGSLEGRRVGIPLGTNAEYLWSLFAALHNIDMEKIDLIDSAPDQIGAALAAGDIEAAVIWAPWLQEIQESSGLHLGFVEGNLDFLYASKWVIVTSKGNNGAQDHRHELVLGSYLEAVDWIQRHPEKAADMFHEKWSVGDQDTEAVALEDAIFDVTLDWSLYASYHQQLRWAKEAGYPTSGSTGDFLSAIHTGSLRSVSPSSVLLPAPASLSPE